jgi:hypothetical protein
MAINFFKEKRIPIQYKFSKCMLFCCRPSCMRKSQRVKAIIMYLKSDIDSTGKDGGANFWKYLKRAHEC